MALDHIPIESITKKHLLDLIDNKVPEGKTIDYKQMLKLQTSKEKKDFLNDISAFAIRRPRILMMGFVLLHC